MDRELLRLCLERGDDIIAVRELVEQGADVNCEGSDGDNYTDTPVTNSILAGNVKILEYLLKNEADPNYSSSYDLRGTPKFVAMDFNQPECLAMILATGVEVNEVTDEHIPDTLLRHAAFHDLPECMSVLLQGGGVDIDKLCGGKTALHVATGLRCVSMLLDQGANVNARSSNGGTALWHAANRGGRFAGDYLQIADLLARRGATEDLASNDGRTPMDIAQSRQFYGYIARFDKKVRRLPFAQVRHSISQMIGDTPILRVLQGEDTAWYIKQFL